MLYFVHYLSEKQKILLEKALKRIGFLDDNHKIKYLKSLEDKYYYMIDRTNDKYVIISNIIYKDIMQEYNFKKIINHEDIDEPENHIQSLVHNSITSYITASDIAQYVFCPVSYCIKKSFKDFQTAESENGIKLHKKARLIEMKDNKFKLNKNILFEIDYTRFVEAIKKPVSVNRKIFTDELNESEVIYVGHVNSDIKYYKSSKGKFIGQPDYIFKNKYGEVFVVEEKFKQIARKTDSFRNNKNISDDDNFHQNHKEQIISYIHGLDTLNIHHGYLIYWYYDEHIHVSRYFDVIRFDKLKTMNNSLKSTYKNIISLSNNKTFDFYPELINTNKCISCVVRKYCAHKTGRFTSLSLPYDESYYSLLKLDEECNLNYDYGDNPRAGGGFIEGEEV